MKHVWFSLLTFTLFAAVAAAAESLEKRMHLGEDNGTHNLGTCPGGGNCIGVFVEVPAGYHIVGIQRKLGSSNFVHSCDPHEQEGTPNCKWREGIDKIGSSAYRYIPGERHNKAEWLGWTNSGDKSQAYTLVVLYERGD
jgi:hypothetical protein